MSNRERGARHAIRYYTKKDRRKYRAFNHDFVLPKYFAEMIGDKKSVLIADLGAGSICTLGNQWPGVEVKILASDLLADEYNEIWKNRNYKILNPVTKQDMEHLTYPDNYFDIVHCVNAVDHSENPRAAIAEMIRVCKPGGWVYLRHIQEEGKNENYHGFHQWNITPLTQWNECLIWSRHETFRLSEFGNFLTEVKTEISNTMYPGEESVVSKMQKPERRIGVPSRRVADFHLNLEHFPGSERRVGMLDRRGAVVRTKIVNEQSRHVPPRIFEKYKLAGAYHWRDYDRGTKYKRHADRVKEWIEESTILDIGAGDGKITSMLGPFCVGIDNEPEGVKLAQQHGVKVILGDAYNLPYIDEMFESVLMADVLEHFEFPEKALAEARRVLTKYIYITTPPKRADGKLTDRYHWREYEPRELVKEVEAIGFVLDGEVDVVLQDKVMYSKFRKV